MPDDTIESAHAFLVGHTRGDLRFDEHVRPLKYVVGPDGRLTASVMVAMLETMDTVLFIPECVEGAMELQVSLEPIDDHGDTGALTDRWRIYHGMPEDVRWAVMTPDAARYEGEVIDGEALIRPNPLVDDGARICRHMNREHQEDLRLLCARFGGINVEQPVMVGVDPLGIDVRGRFEVVRVAATEPMETAADVRRVLVEMTRQARVET